MALLDYQRALGRLVVNGEVPAVATASLGDAELISLNKLPGTAGLRLTNSIQRSWARGRAVKSAPLTLSLLSPSERESMIAGWVENTVSPGSFFSTVALSFLRYLAERLPDPSHVLTVCRFELAVLRASLGALANTERDLARPEGQATHVCVGKYASLVPFHAEPSVLLNAVMNGTALPDLHSDDQHLLFAPLISGFFRPADETDIAAWRILAKPTPAFWLRRKWSDDYVDRMLTDGAAEVVADPVGAA